MQCGKSSKPTIEHRMQIHFTFTMQRIALHETRPQPGQSKTDWHLPRGM